MEDTENNEKLEPDKGEIEKPVLMMWQEWGIIFVSLFFILIGPVCCIFFAQKYRTRTWAEKVRSIGYVVIVHHLLIVIIIPCSYYMLTVIPIALLLILPIVYVITGLCLKISELKSALLKIGSLSLVFQIAACCFFAPPMTGSRRSAWENRCKLTLRALASSQLAYLDQNPDKSFAVWDEMISANYLQEGYTRTNIIDNYSVAVFSVKRSTYDEEGKNNLDSTFTIVAIPRSQKNRLRTFGISDDQTPCVWVGDAEKWSTENVSLNNLDLWEPLR